MGHTLTGVAVVAHPDDCIIYAWPFFEFCGDIVDWTVVYLTYTEQDPRAQEVTKFWNARGIKTCFLGQLDDYNQVIQGQLGFDGEVARQLINNSCTDADIILTHAADGDYGHLHHVFVHECVYALGKPLVCFANWETKNLVCNRSEVLNLDEIPVHRDAVKDWKNMDVGLYNLDERSDELIKKTAYLGLFS
jgi:LmbE family N-acetylglucosaminyl deacetylase